MSTTSSAPESHPPTETTEHTPHPGALRAVAGSFVGTAIEWYDFFIYGTAAALVFGPQFFPASSELGSTLAAFATLAIGFIARPFGGVVMGHFGDKLGRKSMLVVSLFLMGGATILIGLLPTYATIGVWAPILLVALRFVQGIGVGGEWGGAVLMATEHAPPGKAGLYGAAPQIGVPAGLVLANVVFLLVNSVLTPAQFTAWGWRIPFLLSATLIAVAMWIRLGIMESPAFAAAEGEHAIARLPVAEVMTKNWKTIVLAGGTFIATNGIAYCFMVYVLNYGVKTLGFSQSTMLALLIASTPVWMFAMAFSAYHSDVLGRRRVYIWASVLLLVVAPFFFAAIDTRSLPVMACAYLLLAFSVGCTAGPQSALFAEIFPPHLRYSGASLGYQLGAILGGGLAPIIATALYARFHTSWAIGAYFAVLALISLISILLLKAPDIRRARDRGAVRTTPERN